MLEPGRDELPEIHDRIRENSSAMTFSTIVFSKDYLPNIGGVAAHVHGLARGLCASGQWVRVVTERPGRWTEPHTWHSRSVVRDGVTAIELTQNPFLGEVGLGMRWRRVLQPVLQAARQQGTEVVLHVHWGTPWYFKTNSIRVFTNHTSAFLRDLEAKDADRWRELFRHFDWIIAPSRELAEKTLVVGFDSARVSYIPNGVDVENFKPDSEQRGKVRRRLGIAEDAVVILSARRFVPKNGVIDFAHALRFLSHRLDSTQQEKVVVLFAGNSDGAGSLYEKEVLGELQLSPLGRRARLLGPVPNAEMPPLYAAADLSVLPSLKEATSISGLESMASGTSLVGTKVGGIPDLIQHNVDGLLVEHGDPPGLADALKLLIENPTLRQDFGHRACRKARDEFSWERITQRTKEVYRQASEVAQRRQWDTRSSEISW